MVAALAETRGRMGRSGMIVIAVTKALFSRFTGT